MLYIWIIQLVFDGINLGRMFPEGSVWVVVWEGAGLQGNQGFAPN